MQTIGEKIEEARKRKGISLSEAAEVTKIRKDFLLNIESNEYDYSLPEIYKRGFIKNYAKYLKLNPEKVLSQYQEQLLAHNNRAKKSNSDLFGTSSELNDTEDPGNLDPFLDKPSYGKINLKKPVEKSEELSETAESIPNKDLYIKTAIFGVSTLLFIFGIFWLIHSISQTLSPNKNTIQNPISSSTTGSTSEIINIPEDDEYPIKEITLKASGSVYVIIRQQLDNKILLSKELMNGEIQTVKSKGPVDVAFTKGNLITFFTDGEAEPFKPDSKSAGKITLQ